jgi:hypothetical protein
MNDEPQYRHPNNLYNVAVYDIDKEVWLEKTYRKTTHARKAMRQLGISKAMISISVYMKFSHSLVYDVKEDRKEAFYHE